MHFYTGRVYGIGSSSGTIQERRTKENAHKKAKELKYDFTAASVTFVNCEFEDLEKGDTVLFSLTCFDGKPVIDTIEMPVYDL